MLGAPAAFAEFARSMRERPLQVCLLLSFLVHAALFSFIKVEGRAAQGRNVRTVLVRILRLETAPAAAAASAVAPPLVTAGMAVQPSPAIRPSFPAAGSRPAIADPPPLPPAFPSLPEPSLPASPATAMSAEAGAGMVGAAPAVDAAPQPVALAVADGGGPGSPTAAEAARPATEGAAAPSPPGGAGDVPPGGTLTASGASSGGGRNREGLPPGEQLAALRRRIDACKMYPRLAVRNGWQGEVVVELLIGGGGRLEDVRLVRGSGYVLLDEATLVAVKRAAPYPPLEGRVTVPVDYRLTP